MSLRCADHQSWERKRAVGKEEIKQSVKEAIDEVRVRSMKAGHNNRYNLVTLGRSKRVKSSSLFVVRLGRGPWRNRVFPTASLI